MLLNTSVNCEDGVSAGQPPTAVFIDGEIDVEPWADAQEVTLDRVVGMIHWYGYTLQPASGSAANSQHLPLIKAGLLLEEGFLPSTASPVKNLWDQEQLEDHPWMWLWSGFPTVTFAERAGPTNNALIQFALSIPVDIRVRRKVGQTDGLCFYSSWASPAPDFDAQVLQYTDVRAILMSK